MNVSANKIFIKAIDQAITKNKSIKILKGDVKILKGDVKILKGDVKILKSDVRILKGDVKILKDDVKILKGDVKTLKEDGFLLKHYVQALLKKQDVFEFRLERIEAQIGTIAEGVGWLIESRKKDELRFGQLEAHAQRCEGMQVLTLEHIRNKTVHLKPVAKD